MYCRSISPCPTSLRSFGQLLSASSVHFKCVSAVLNAPSTLEFFLNGAELSLKFSDFSQFKESDKLLKHELASI